MDLRTIRLRLRNRRTFGVALVALIVFGSIGIGAALEGGSGWRRIEWRRGQHPQRRRKECVDHDHHLAYDDRVLDIFGILDLYNDVADHDDSGLRRTDASPSTTTTGPSPTTTPPADEPAGAVCWRIRRGVHY